MVPEAQVVPEDGHSPIVPEDGHSPIVPEDGHSPIPECTNALER